MAKDCCNHECSNPKLLTPKYQKILWIALVINATMFMVEILSGINAQSVSLMADAIDFFGDAMNYGISLAVLSMSLAWRARTALFKGLTMGIFGLLVGFHPMVYHARRHTRSIHNGVNRFDRPACKFKRCHDALCLS